MDVSQDLSSTADDSPVYESDSEMTSSFTRKVDEITESELKKIEVQKMEGELAIRTLEQVYRESKKNLFHAQKKLGEARKKEASQAERIGQLMRANTAIVEKFNELKNYQIDVILSNVSEFEKTTLSCQGKNAGLSNTLQMILDHGDYLERLQKDVRDKKAVVNEEIQREIEEKKVVFVQLNELMTRSRGDNEKFKMSLNHEMSDHNYNQALLDERAKKIVKFEADEDSFQAKITKELEILEQERLKLQNFLNNNSRILDEKKILNSQIQAELVIIKKSNKDKNELFTKLESKREQLVNEVQKRSQVIDSSKQVLDENIRNINDSQAKIDAEIELARSRFLENEENMQAELKCLYTKIEEKKKRVEIFENCQKELTKLKEKKLSKQKESTNIDQELQNKVKDSSNELKNQEQILLDKNKIQSELDSKIKKLQEEKNNVKLKVESLDKDKEDKLRNNSFQSSDISKTHNSNEINRKDSDVFNKKVESTSAKKCNYSFDFDDSDESEDEKFLKNTSLQKLTQIKTPSYKKSECNYNFNNVATSNKNQESNLPMSDRLFEDLLSQVPSDAQSSTEFQSTSNDTGVFKVPHPYQTPFKKKYTAKYNKK